MLLPRALVATAFYALTALPLSAAVQEDLPARIGEYQADRGAVGRLWRMPLSADAQARKLQLQADWRARLDAMDFEALPPGRRVDWLLLSYAIDAEISGLEWAARQDLRTAQLHEFAPPLVGLLEEFARREDPREPEAIAGLLAEASVAVEAATEALEERAADLPGTDVHRAGTRVEELRRAVASFVRFRDEYDPLFSWWTAAPAAALDEALRDYAKALRKHAGTDDEDKLLGDPIGAAALNGALRAAMIAYSPQELIAVAESEWAWCEKEMLRASAELGFGDDWRAAMNHVKELHVPPGEQPELIRRLAHEAVEFVESRDLITIPALCKESWRMQMMSTARQRVTPYFTGGEVISIAYPTAEMSHADKRMALRGNNEHFSRATVHHELIPGHHLQQYMTSRYATWRRPFGTPFWGEGWALYWELRLWDLEFPRGPEDRVGMLFWRMHRCARILFSLNFHLGEWSADECVDFLVERVGHERRNATAEVRRSIAGNYGPLYQAAYMTGGLQLEALRREVVESGRMTDKQFHDTVLRNGSIPIELLRALLLEQELDRDFTPNWKFHRPR
jgi:uncharacterized protein (DUF885 family)